jgi:hypothetical protein
MQPMPKMSWAQRSDADCGSEAAETLIVDDMIVESFFAADLFVRYGKDM